MLWYGLEPHLGAHPRGRGGLVRGVPVSTGAAIDRTSRMAEDLPGDASGIDALLTEASKPGENAAATPAGPAAR
jgi:hypothetical protein